MTSLEKTLAELNVQPNEGFNRQRRNLCAICFFLTVYFIADLGPADEFKSFGFFGFTINNFAVIPWMLISALFYWYYRYINYLNWVLMNKSKVDLQDDYLIYLGSLIASEEIESKKYKLTNNQHAQSKYNVDKSNKNLMHFDVKGVMVIEGRNRRTDDKFITITDDTLKKLKQKSRQPFIYLSPFWSEYYLPLYLPLLPLFGFLIGWYLGFDASQNLVDSVVSNIPNLPHIDFSVLQKVRMKFWIDE